MKESSHWRTPNDDSSLLDENDDDLEDDDDDNDYNGRRLPAYLHIEGWFLFKIEVCTVIFILPHGMGIQGMCYTDRKNVTNFLYLVLHWACKVTCYYQLVSSVLFSVLRTSTNVLSKSKSRNCVTWIPNVAKLFLSVSVSD